MRYGKKSSVLNMSVSRRRLLLMARVALFIMSLPAIIVGRFSPVKKNVGHIVLKVDAIGDFILSFGFLKYEAEFNNSLIITGSNVSEFASREFPKSNFLLVDQDKMNRDIFYRFTFLYRISRLQCDSVFNLQRSRVLHVSDQITLAIRSKNKLTLQSDYSSSSKLESVIASKIYRDVVPVQSQQEHETLSYAGLLGYDMPRFSIKANSDTELAEKYLLISISASTDEKTFPHQALFDSLREIKELPKLVFVGDKRHRHAIDLLGPLPHAFEWMVGETSLIQLSQLIRNSAAVITSDSLAGHLAQNLDRPYIALRSGLHWGRFFPYPQPSKWSIVYPRTKYCKCKIHCADIDSASEIRPCLGLIHKKEVSSLVQKLVEKI